MTSSDNSVKLALIVDDGGYDESSTQVVDLIRLQPLSPTIYIIETKPFNNSSLNNGAGTTPFSKEQISFLLSSLHP